MKLSAVIDELVEDRNLDREVIKQVIIDGYAAAYEKKFPENKLRVEYDQQSDSIVVFAAKEVVPSPVDPELHISRRKARTLDPDAALGDTVWVPIDEPIGRIEVLRARQVITSQIAQIEASAVYDQFEGKRGTIVYGVVHKCEGAGTIVKVGEALAFLPRSLDIPGIRCIPGYTIRALLKDVMPEPKNETQLILDRASDQFIKSLFRLEVPEIFEGLVEIKKISRAPGYKSKVAVVSHDPNIDPVGTCVGVGGARIKPILRELGAEKIDVLFWNENLEQFVAAALKPAQINRVELDEDESIAQVWLDDDQRPLAIGKGGKNIVLASVLAGVEISLAGGRRAVEEVELSLNSVDEPSGADEDEEKTTFEIVDD